MSRTCQTPVWTATGNTQIVHVELSSTNQYHEHTLYIAVLWLSHKRIATVTIGLRLRVTSKPDFFFPPGLRVTYLFVWRSERVGHIRVTRVTMELFLWLGLEPVFPRLPHHITSAFLYWDDKRKGEGGRSMPVNSVASRYQRACLTLYKITVRRTLFMFHCEEKFTQLYYDSITRLHK